MTSLSNEQIRKLYATYDGGQSAGHRDWVNKVTAAFSAFQAKTDEELASPEVQADLWRDARVSGLGYSEGIPVDPLYATEEFTKELIGLRRDPLPPDADQRARVLEERFQRMLQVVRQGLKSNTKPGIPVARLKRLFLLMRPEDCHSVLKTAEANTLRDLLAPGNRGEIASHCRVRARLREVLGKETDLHEHAVRITFCWWLAQEADFIGAGGEPEGSLEGDLYPDGHTNGGAASTSGEQSTTELLFPWPREIQMGWWDTLRGGLDTLRAPLRFASEAQHWEDLQLSVADDLGPDLGAPDYVRKVVRFLRRLDLIHEKDGVWQTTESGKIVVHTTPPGPLIEALVVRVRGMAQLLTLLRNGAQSRERLRDALSGWMDGPSGGQIYTRLLTWGRVVGLLEPEGKGRWRLTEEGGRWAARLPESVPGPFDAHVPQGTTDLPIKQGGKRVATQEAMPTLAEVVDQIATDGEEFVLDPRLARSVYTAWNFHKSKHFVLLAGLSGTGKTQLLMRMANAVCAELDLDEAEHVALVAVRPDWRDPSGLLGYANVLHAETRFEREEALRLVLRAAADPGRPYFLILDEMNLARVEHYFAPFLSAMESGGDLHLHGGEEEIDGVPPAVTWPTNLRIGGTVNMDESTHPFSDKVLDRAFTVEIWEVDLAGFLERRRALGPVFPDLEQVEAVLTGLYADLRPARRHFGYRAAGEVLDYVAAGRRMDPDAKGAELLDEAVLAKILPRLRGEDGETFRTAVEAAKKRCSAANLHQCASKLTTIGERLRQVGVAGFWS